MIRKKNIKENKSSLIIRRDVINKLLDKIIQFKVIYISGTIGCGKTTAVKEWCKNIDEQILWLSIDDKMKCCNFADLITNEAEKFNKNNRLKIIVIDNFQKMKDKNNIQFSIIEQLSDEYRFIFISNSVLPNGLKYFLVKKELEPITCTELLFSDEEILEYFKINGFNIDNNNLEKIKKITYGWVTALDSIVETLKFNNNEFNDKMYMDAILNVYEFLNYRIFQGLDQDIKKFIMITSLLDEVDLGVARFVTENEDLEKIINKVIDRESFFIKIRPRVYKYDKYAREYLKYEREKVYSKDSINEIYKRIGEYYAKNNENLRALEYYCRGDFYKEAIPILEQVAYDACRSFDLRAVDKYISMIPEEYINKSPSLCGTKFLSSFIYKKEDLNKVYENLINMKNSIPEEGYRRAVLEIRILYAQISLPKMKPNEILKSFKKCNPIFKKNGVHVLPICLTFNIPSILRGIRDFSSWGIHYKFVEKIMKKNIMDMFGKSGLGMLDIAIAEFLYEQNDLNNALIRASKGVADSSNEGFVGIYFIGMIVLIKILRTQGQIYKVEEMINILEKKIKDEKAYYLEENLKALQVRNEISLGNIDYSLKWLNNLQESIIDEFSINKIYIYIAKVRAYICNSMYSQALIVLQGLSVKLKGSNRVLDMIEINVLRAECFYKSNEEQMALYYIDLAVKSAFRYKYVRTFANEGKLCSIILTQYLKSRKGVDSEYKKYVKNIINEANKSVFLSNDNIAEAINSLTKSEEEILSLLIEGFKYSEISEHLNIKLPTVKTHISNIYAKLNVKNKKEAISAVKSIEKN